MENRKKEISLIELETIAREEKIHVSGSVSFEPQIKLDYAHIWARDRKHQRELIQKYALEFMEKDLYDGHVQLKGENFTLWASATCKIVGYETKKIPAQKSKIEKIPIYKCNGE